MVPLRTTRNAQTRLNQKHVRPVGRHPLAHRMNEKDLQSIVMNLARRYGWMIHHDLPAMSRTGKWATWQQGDVGFPDLLLVHPNKGQMLVIELKSERGKTTTSQDNWLAAFSLAGIETYVIKPSDLEFITQRLTRPDLYK